jgi:hypothetical protein
MKVNRRIVLKQLAVISAVAVFAPSCSPSKGKAPKLFKNVAVTEDQEATLSSIADTLIPKTSTPGALELKVPEFMAKLIDDCQTKQDQEKWLAGMNKFFAEVKKKKGKSFTDLTAEERLKFLTDFESTKTEDEELNFFYRTTRSLAIRGYTSSEYFMTTVQNYNILPGAYKGCVPVNNPS